MYTDRKDSDRQTVLRLRRAHKEEPQVHYAPGFDLLAGAKQTQKLAYTASNRETCLKLQTKSVAFVLLNTGEGPRRLGGRHTTLSGLRFTCTMHGKY